MEVKIISTECIKPSSPTPNHPKFYKFSAIDQFMGAPIYISMAFFYPVDGSLDKRDNSKRTLLLKQSLSETLTRFYPLAGKIKDNVLGIDCNDEGVYYVEARVDNIPLSDYLKQPDLSSLNSLLPASDDQTKYSHQGSHVAMIKEITFACGGLVIGASISHLFADGAAFGSVLRAWATAARKFSSNGKEEMAVVFPNLDAPSIFPQKDGFSMETSSLALLSPILRTGRPVLRRFLFDTSAIAGLKAEAINSRLVENPTRVEVVSALLSKSIMEARRARTGVQRPTLIAHTVNIRRRAVPPLPESSMGNIGCLAAALCKTDEETKLPGALVHRLKEAIGKIDGEFVKGIQCEGAAEKLYEITREATSALTSPEFSSTGVDCVSFTSWCNFGLYDADFGWGRPVWVTGKGAPTESETVFMNLIILMDTRMGKGIEAWVFLDEEEMLILERNQELLALASLDPSPLDVEGKAKSYEG